jgi:hypothetical protein
VPALLATARSGGNLYIATELCTRSNYVSLAADDPDEGERVTLKTVRMKGGHVAKPWPSTLRDRLAMRCADDARGSTGRPACAQRLRTGGFGTPGSLW